MSDKLPVMAFGHPIPKLAQKWFSFEYKGDAQALPSSTKRSATTTTNQASPQTTSLSTTTSITGSSPSIILTTMTPNPSKSNHVRIPV